MNQAAPPATPESLAHLRHRLRTPLNHLVGYSEMLLEDTGKNWQADEGLRNIIADANVMLRLVHAYLSGSASRGVKSSDGQPDLNGLRAALQPPLHHAARICGELTSNAPAQNVLDLLRISTAVGELLSFSSEKAQESSLQPTQIDAGTPAQSKPGNCVLVADDDEVHRDIIKRQLERLGYSVVLAEDGARALEKLAASKIDLVLIDMIMPGMTGLEVLEAIKANVATQHIPVVMVSALDDISNISLCIERGAQDYLFKPFDPVLLQARIEAALERTKLVARERERTEVLEQMSRELRRSNEELRNFAYAASHDLQSPLRTIVTHLQLLDRRLSSQISSDDAKLLGFAVDAAKRMSQLINDILVYSQASTQETDLRPVACEDVLKWTLSDLASQVAEFRAVVSHDCLPVLMADAAQLRQLFLNLVGNAIKYRKDEEVPRVHLGAVYEDEAWHFRVTDNGVGIEPIYLNEVFKMFRRLHGQERPGTGLGLAICDRIVQRLHGKIWVESEPGVGSTFHFTIPGPMEIVSEP